MNNDNESRNRDEEESITATPEAHPVGTGVGAAGGAATGVAIGAAGGPAGMAIGGVLGAVAGGLAGNAVAEGLDPAAEDAHWSGQYRDESYYQEDYDYPDYEPAYRMGYQSCGQGRKFEDSETELSDSWDEYRGDSRLEWEHARPAAMAGWDRVQRAYPGDGDDTVRDL